MNSTTLSVNFTAFFSEAASFLGVVVLSGYMRGYTVTAMHVHIMHGVWFARTKASYNYYVLLKKLLTG